MTQTQIERRGSADIVERGRRTRFTTENAAEMARRSVQLRKQRNDAALQRRAEIEHIIETLDRDDLGPYTLAAALAAAHLALSGELEPPETVLDRLRLGELAQILQRIGRLELGESTSNAAHATVDASELASKRAAILAQLAPLDPPAAPPA